MYICPPSHSNLKGAETDVQTFGLVSEPIGSGSYILCEEKQGGQDNAKQKRGLESHACMNC
jgi:hypothetical protein